MEQPRVCMACRCAFHQWTPRVEPTCDCQSDLYCTDCFATRWTYYMNCRQCAQPYTDQRGSPIRELYEYRDVIPTVVVVLMLVRSLLAPLTLPALLPPLFAWSTCKLMLHVLFGDL